MDIRIYDDPRQFCRDNEAFLYRRELENNLPVSIMERLRDKDSAGRIFLCSVLEGGTPVLVAMMTPPWDMLLSAEKADRESLGLLVKALGEKRVPVPGFLAEKTLAAAFRDLWEEAAPSSWQPFREERIYRLTRCRRIPLSGGEMRKGTEEDRDLLVDWNLAFHKEVGEEMNREEAERMIADVLEQTFLWQKGGRPVSLCCSARETRNGRIINMVYTPPEFRGTGYASSLVRTRCGDILERGREFCGLFTDLSNPVSNSIYRKIGFEPVMDLLHYRAKQV